MPLSKEHHSLLMAMAHDHFLKSHRDIDGHKSYLLHPLHGDPQPIAPHRVQQLRDNGDIDSNKKFPVATFWLTDKGKSTTNTV
jgi:hypothetical protein